jgi:RsiW-degrading membrane proteinase PrsW (M82 family)
MNPNQPPPFPPPPGAGLPPVPRDHAAASFSEIIPVGSSKINLAKSPATLLLILAAIIAPLTLVFSASLEGAGLRQGFLNLAFMTVFFVTFAICLIVYLYARPGRSLLPYLWAYALVTVLMTPLLFGIPFVFNAISYVFNDLLIGDAASGPDDGFGWAFFSHFVGVGLTEELFKALPILIGLAFGFAAARKPAAAVGPFQRFFRIRGPLDGVIMGAFAGAAFILLETAGLYLPNTLTEVTERVRTVLIDNPDGRELSEYVGLSQALLLYFPRVIGGAVGHMAYSGIFGYFIGLALLRPRQGIFLILMGWVLASALHGLWNGIATVAQSDSSSYYIMIPAGLSAIFFAAVLLKARQLHFAVHGDAPDTMGSIVIVRSGGGAAFPPPFGGIPPQPGVFPQSPSQAAPLAGYAGSPVAPPPLPARAPEQPLLIEIAGVAIPLREGAVLDLGAEPALEGRGAGVRGEIVPHPRRPGVLGIRNAGDGIWTAHLRDGRDQQIGKSQNVRLAEGVRIDFGDGLVGDVKSRLT